MSTHTNTTQAKERANKTHKLKKKKKETLHTIDAHEHKPSNTDAKGW